MKAKDLRELDIQALEGKITELNEMRAKYNVNPDQGLKNNVSYRSSRKEIARIKTVINEKRVKA